MKRIDFKRLAAIAGIAALLTFSAGCSNNGASDAQEEAGVQTIIVGTGTEYEPYCYLDDNGNLAGYELEVLKAVDELLPQYEFEYQTMAFKNILVSLGAGQIDLAAHQYETNPEREENYLFGKESYTTFVTYPVVLTSRTDIQTLDDLAGKVVYVPTGDNSQYYIEEYNNAHPDNPIIIENADSLTPEEITQGLKNGRWDATNKTKRDIAVWNEEYGNGSDFLRALDEPLQSSSTYYLYQKGNTELQEAVDGALKELKASGRLAEISVEVLGGDYTESE